VPKEERKSGKNEKKRGSLIGKRIRPSPSSQIEATKRMSEKSTNRNYVMVFYKESPVRRGGLLFVECTQKKITKSERGV